MFNKELYNKPFHSIDLSNYSFLVTGGAGFIGSNLVEYLLRYNAKKVRVLDNLSNGYFGNIKNFTHLSNFQFINGDIRDYQVCKEALEGIDFLSHQAALGSVPRSIADPLTSNEVNVGGFLNILNSAKESNSLKRMVYAASSSTYGDSQALPKIEGNEGTPLSPYAVTKLVNELYANVFNRVYNFKAIGLRYFNIFGPKQNPNNPYAAVIPLFCKHFINKTRPIIFGDGITSRDFTFVENAVQANIKVLLRDFEPSNPLNDKFINDSESDHNLVFNVACGDQISLNEIIIQLQLISGNDIEAIYSNERSGDVRHSLASISKLKNFCGYDPSIHFNKGLKLVFEWYQNNNNL